MGGKKQKAAGMQPEVEKKEEIRILGINHHMVINGVVVYDVNVEKEGKRNLMVLNST